MSSLSLYQSVERVISMLEVLQEYFPPCRAVVSLLRQLLSLKEEPLGRLPQRIPQARVILHKKDVPTGRELARMLGARGVEQPYRSIGYVDDSDTLHVTAETVSHINYPGKVVFERKCTVKGQIDVDQGIHARSSLTVEGFVRAKYDLEVDGDLTIDGGIGVLEGIKIAGNLHQVALRRSPYAADAISARRSIHIGGDLIHLHNIMANNDIRVEGEIVTGNKSALVFAGMDYIVDHRKPTIQCRGTKPRIGYGRFRRLPEEVHLSRCGRK